MGFIGLPKKALYKLDRGEQVYYHIKFILISDITMKRTFQPNKRKRKKNHGFLVRMRTRDGQKIVNSRRQKGRKRLAG